MEHRWPSLAPRCRNYASEDSPPPSNSLKESGHGAEESLHHSPPFALGRVASHVSISDSDHARVLAASLMPGGKPCFSTHRFSVGQFLMMPLALRSAKRSNTFDIPLSHSLSRCLFPQ